MEQRETPHFDWMWALVYLCLSFGAAMLSLYADMALRMPHGITLTWIFGAPALIAWLFYRRFAWRGWLIASGGFAAVAAFIFSVYLAAERILHPALLFALYAFGAAGMIIYFINRRRSADSRPLNARIGFEQLGTREKTPAERDVPRAA